MMRFKKLVLRAVFLITLIGFVSCSTDKNINRAKLVASKYWTDKAYPGKAYDVQVTEAVKVDDGKYRVKALVDGQQRVGLFNPDTEVFDEGYYTLSYERGKKIAEMEEEVRYLKDKVEKIEKENYQLKLRLKYASAGKGDPVELPNGHSSNTDSEKKSKKPLKESSMEPGSQDQSSSM